MTAPHPPHSSAHADKQPQTATPFASSSAAQLTLISDKTRADLMWEQLTEHLASRCHTERGAQLARALGPLPTRQEAQLRQQEISEARGLQDAGEPLPLGGITDISQSVLHCSKGGVLMPTELWEIANTLAACSRLRRHLMARAQLHPRLYAHAERLFELPEVSGPIHDSFDEQATLKDSASPALGGLRQRVNHLQQELARRTSTLLLEPHIEPYLQDRFVTQREERFVVPVRADARTRIRGIVHGTSSSGSTVFVEPEEVIDLNNRCKLAQLEVAEEERRILIELSRLVEDAVPRIQANLGVLMHLDLIDAAAKLSCDLRATPVELLPTEGLRPQGLQDGQAAAAVPGLDLRNGRHPLMVLSGTEVVPSDVTLPLGGTLIISGPNAGGKTVALKLAGLCALMARAGLHLPVQEGSSIPWYERVLTDVGDDQSIEKNLSTFSAHVLNLCRFVKEAQPSTLILLDEIAVGTDPEQGAALAQALLEAVSARGATVLITTHYDRLKALGASGPRFRNASVGFDLVALKPTYRLHLGIPGASSALIVAERLGMPQPIIGRTKELLTAGQTGAEALMQSLAAERERTLRLQAEALTLRTQAQQESAQTQELLEQARVELAKARRKAHDEAIAALQSARRELTEAKSSLRAHSERTRQQLGELDGGSHAELLRQQKRLDQLSAEISAAAPPKQGPSGRVPTANDIAVGMKVYVPRLGGTGTVVTEPVRDKVVIQVGSLRLHAEVAELLLPDEHGRIQLPRSSATSPTPGSAQLQIHVNTPSHAIPPRTPDSTVDLRGERLPVAIARTEKFVDDALRDSRSAVFVLHGHGTGILRQAIRSHFASFPGIRRVRPADTSDGGDGVTLLELES